MTANQPMTAEQSATLKRLAEALSTPQSNVELMSEKQILDFKPLARLE
jgi:hypothetical protein